MGKDFNINMMDKIKIYPEHPVNPVNFNKLSVVIPVYNEVHNIDILYEKNAAVLRNIGKDYEIVFVNDGSRDGSLEKLKELKNKDPKVRIISFKRNHGQTAAMDAGFKYSTGDVIVTMDADLQNDPADIPLLLEQLDKYDAVIGWRHKRNDPWIKLVSSKIANWVRNKLSGETVTDTGCSLKAYKRYCLQDLKLFNGMHRFLPTLIKLEGYTVGEVKVSHHPRLYDSSKYGVWNRVFKSFIDLLAVRWMKKRYLRYKKDVEQF